MNRHPWLRAYMAGVLLPTWVTLLMLASYVWLRMIAEVSFPVERAIAFPMAVVPNLWGLWNLLYVALRLSGRVSLGMFGAVLPVMLVPAGTALAYFLELPFPTFETAVLVIPIGMAVYYLAWKYLVGFFNRVVGLA